MADQLGPEELFEWDVTNMEDPAPDVPIDLCSDDEIESILSQMSEDVPTLDAHTLNGFLMKAAKNIQKGVSYHLTTFLSSQKAIMMSEYALVRHSIISDRKIFEQILILILKSSTRGFLVFLFLFLFFFFQNFG